MNACCAPITSLFSRDTSVPVWVRVKKATGICWTWSKTRVRRSKIRPSPIRGREPALDQPEDGLGHGQRRRRSGRLDDQGRRFSLQDAVVDEHLEQQRRSDGQGEATTTRPTKTRDQPPVGPGEREDRGGARPWRAVVRDLGVLPHPAHHRRPAARIIDMRSRRLGEFPSLLGFASDANVPPHPRRTRARTPVASGPSRSASWRVSSSWPWPSWPGFLAEVFLAGPLAVADFLAGRLLGRWSLLAAVLLVAAGWSAWPSSPPWSPPSSWPAASWPSPSWSWPSSPSAPSSPRPLLLALVAASCRRLLRRRLLGRLLGGGRPRRLLHRARARLAPRVAPPRPRSATRASLEHAVDEAEGSAAIVGDLANAVTRRIPLGVLAGEPSRCGPVMREPFASALATASPREIVHRAKLPDEGWLIMISARGDQDRSLSSTFRRGFPPRGDQLGPWLSGGERDQASEIRSA